MPNEFGGREDLDAVAFLKELNEVAARPRAGRDLRGRGVDRVAGRLAADLRRRARLRLQVEHGLDARHARLLPARPDPPPVPPPRADVLPHVRLQRELHPAAVARRGRARQGLAAHEDAGRPLAEAREPALAVRLHVGAPRQEAAVHGRRVRAGARVEPRRARSTGTCSRTPSTRACSRSCATSTTSTATSPRCGSSTSSRSRLPLARAQRRRRATSSPSPRRRRRRRATSLVVRDEPLAGPARGLPRRPAARRAAGARRSTPTPSSTAARTSATGGVEAEAVPWHGQPYSAGSTLPPLGVVWLVPGD